MKAGGTTPRPASARRLIDLEVDIAGEGLEPRDIGLAIRAGLDPVLAVEEIGHALIGAGELRDRIGDRIAVELAVGDGGDVGDALAEPEHGIEPGLLARRQAAPVDARAARGNCSTIGLVGAGLARRGRDR